MFAQQLSSWLQKRGIHYSWVIAAVTFLTMLTMSAALGLPGAILQPLSKEFGWSNEQISSALALRFALFGLMGPFVAVLMERYGLRRVMCTGLAYILFFRLINIAGPAKALSVTFLVPVFAVLYGALFLGEVVTPWMVLCAAVIVCGTSLSTGLLKLGR